MSAHAIVLYDGVCNLCIASVQFIIRHDPDGYFRFAAQQSDVGQALLAQHGVTQALGMGDDSVMLLEDGRVYTHSDASLRVARRLRGVVKLSYALIVLPRWLRNAVYRLIARTRYRVFGKQTQCWLPTPDLQARFLDA